MTGKTPSGRKVDWGMVIFGIFPIGVGILSATPIITNPVWKEAR